MNEHGVRYNALFNCISFNKQQQLFRYKQESSITDINIHKRG